MEDQMRRVAILLGAVGMMALGIAAIPAPAQAQDGWWGYPGWRGEAWREHEWRRHHSWRHWYYDQGYYHPYRHHGPRVFSGFSFR
jgi:hypothetical protein